MSIFRDKTAVVTGGASGIGRAVCEALGARGATVFVADLDEAGAAEVARGIVAKGGLAEARKVDVRDAESVAALIEGAAAARGRLDYVFNNAGIAIGGEEREVNLDDWRTVIDVDLMGVVYGVRAAYAIMVRQGSGHIINTASIAGLVPTAFEASYAAAKHGVVGLSYALRAEGAALGVKVSVVCPGFIDTPILRNSVIRTTVDRDKALALIPWRMKPEDCAREILAGVEKNRATIVVTRHAKAMWWLHRLSPSISIRLAREFVEKVRKMAQT